jgi:hypothetical protein
MAIGDVDAAGVVILAQWAFVAGGLSPISDRHGCLNSAAVSNLISDGVHMAFLSPVMALPALIGGRPG